MHQSICSPPSPSQAGPGDSHKNSNCLSESPQWARKVVSDTMGDVTGCVSYSTLRMPLDYWGGLKVSVRVPWMGGWKSGRIPLGAHGVWRGAAQWLVHIKQRQTLWYWKKLTFYLKSHLNNKFVRLKLTWVFTYICICITHIIKYVHWSHD